MAKYDYVCATCDSMYEVVRSIHEDGPGPVCCGMETKKRIGGVWIAPSSCPTRSHGGIDMAATRLAEKNKNRDMDAFRELVRQGVTPPQINGSADLAMRAESAHEIKSGFVAQTKEGRKIAEDVLS